MRISFLGDSITYGYELADKKERFSTLICNRMGAEEANHGTTGTLMAKAGENRTDGKSFLDRLDLVLDGDVIVIFGGTNDYFWSDTPIGDKTWGTDGFYRAVDEICKKICECHRERDTLLVTPYPHSGYGNFLGGRDYKDATVHETDELNFNGHRLVDYVDVIEKVAMEYGISVLNLHACTGFDWKVHTFSGCHPNTEGHEWLAKKIEHAIEKMLHG